MQEKMADASAKRIVILTGAELRHDFFRRFMALQPGIEVLCTFCEGTEKSLRNILQRQQGAKDWRERHLQARERAEQDFFGLFVETAPDHSNPVFIPKGEINRQEHVETIRGLQPDLLIAYGCSIIRSSLLQDFAGRFVNIHLGLSPWYRGSGTNFWPLVNDEPELVGVTFMHIDEGVDTGRIIHQMRAAICWGDTPHMIGNRLIRDMAGECARLVQRFDQLEDMLPPPQPEQERYYRKKDFTEEAVVQLYRNFNNGMIEQYLIEQVAREARHPIVQNPALSVNEAAS